MKFDDLRSVGHNLAHSFGSGMSFLFSQPGFDPFADQRRRGGEDIEVDFLTGLIISGAPSPETVLAALDSPRVVTQLCERYGGSVENFRALRATYRRTPFGEEFELTVSDMAGKTAIERFKASNGKRLVRPVMTA